VCVREVVNNNSGDANTKFTNGEIYPRKGVESSLGISCLPFLMFTIP